MKLLVIFLAFPWLKQRNVFGCELQVSLFSGPPEQGPLEGQGGCLVPGLASENRGDSVLEIMVLVPRNPDRPEHACCCGAQGR